MVLIHSELQDQLNCKAVQNSQPEIKENHLQKATGACFCS